MMETEQSNKNWHFDYEKIKQLADEIREMTEKESHICSKCGKLIYEHFHE